MDQQPPTPPQNETPQNMPPSPTGPAGGPHQSPSMPPTPGKAKGYGKRPMWQWAVIYLVAAIVVYFLIWLIFIRKSGGSTNSLY